jgi:MFS family permease
MEENTTEPTMETINEAKIIGRRNILAVGFASFFGGVSQDIFIPILPLYLTQILGFDKALVGIAEGLVSAFASIFKVIAGRMSDKFGQQKPIISGGYALSMLGRGLLALASGPLAVFGLRCADGIGKGIKDPPKKVVVANAADVNTRGRSFGIARMLDTFGSALGPLLLSGLLYIFIQHHVTPQHYYRWLLVLAATVLFITIAVVQLGIKEPKNPKIVKIDTNAPLSKSFYVFTVIAGIFAIANSSDAFLILRSQNLGLSIIAIPIAYAVLNVVYGSLSLPAGIISDKVGRIPMITLGWIVYGLCYLGFALAKSAWQVWPLFALYGIFYAASDGVVSALIADLVGSHARGKAYGIYSMVTGLAALPAGIIAGLLWDHISPSAPFFFSAILSLIAVALIFAFKKRILLNLA